MQTTTRCAAVGIAAKNERKDQPRSEAVPEHQDVLFRMTEAPSAFRLEYRLVELEQLAYGSEMTVPCDSVDGCCNRIYSILIIMSDRYGGVETEFLYDVTRDANIARALMKLLCDGAVTPCTAKYVISDLL